MVYSRLVKLHDGIQEPQSNDDCVTDNMLIVVSHIFEEDKGLCLANDEEKDKTDEILYKKHNQKMAVQLMSHFFLHHKNQKKTKDDSYLGNDDENNEINENLFLISFVYVCFDHKNFYHCNEDHCGMCMIFWCSKKHQ